MHFSKSHDDYHALTQSSSRRGGEGLAMVSSIGVAPAAAAAAAAVSSTTGSCVIINFPLLLSDVVTFSYSLSEVLGFAVQSNSVELTCSPAAGRAFPIFELPCKDVDGRHCLSLDKANSETD
uniref:Uncharacterized protein n=1 Tax=Glossina pallidipes TaxID=7398 RepID=A0A1B0A5N7_GLOPL